MGAHNSAEYAPLFESVDELLITLSPGLTPARRAVRRRLWSGLDASEAPCLVTLPRYPVPSVMSNSVPRSSYLANDNS